MNRESSEPLEGAAQNCQDVLHRDLRVPEPLCPVCIQGEAKEPVFPEDKSREVPWASN